MIGSAVEPSPAAPFADLSLGPDRAPGASLLAAYHTLSPILKHANLVEHDAVISREFADETRAASRVACDRARPPNQNAFYNPYCIIFSHISCH